ncbi:type III-A CRISPR-associated protein Cas10/Csm1 [Neomoorella thermoacetica]|uniref:type III-A CRISPR-associated protein Cas10/Csm1 n=1 Tax=Neomoorella thermoacetica TaxID=1525 RepID=UPI0030CB3620
MKREAVVLGSLLHDIGKIIYRAVPPDQRHSHRHQELGFTWAREVGLPEEVQEVIRRHHSIKKSDAKYDELSPDAYAGPIEIKNLIYLVGEADNIAAGMERLGQQGEGDFDIEQGMGVIFDKVSLNAAVKKRHCWQPVFLEEAPYPIPAEQIPRGRVMTFYASTWKNLRAALQDKRNLQEERLLLLLEKYLSQVPEHSYTTASSWPDTSLFHHLRSTASISWCTYLNLTAQKVDWEKENLKKTIGAREEARYLLVGADLSGIQKFIYTITSKAALKTVRARSFFLDLLVESAAVQLCRELGLGRFNIIYASGGGFYLLAPNTQECKKQIKDFQKSFNAYLYNTFGPSLYLCLAYTALSGEDLKGKQGRLQAAWGEVQQELHLEKNQKWQFLLTKDPAGFLGPKPVAAECAICHRTNEVKPVKLDEDTFELCSFCQIMIQLGKILPEIENFYEAVPGAAVKGLTIKIKDCIYAFEGRPSEIAGEYQLRHPWQLPTGSWPVLPFPVGSYYSRKEFIELAGLALGDKKIGVIRMDVDHLGQLFARGLQEATFARLSDLSSRLNIYFKYYLPRLLAKVEGGILPVDARKIPINIVYAGGDDLFLVGTWDAALEAAWAINNDFQLYTALNPDITISGGLVIADEKVALYKLADLAAAAEGKAKDDGRNRLALLGKSLTWQEMERVAAYLKIFGSGLKQEGLSVKPELFSRGFFSRFMALVEKFNNPAAERSQNRAWVYPALYYLFARARAAAGKDKDKFQFYQSLLAVCLNTEALERFMLPVLLVLKLLLRGAREDA